MTPTVTKCPLYRPYAGTLGFDESVPHGPDVPGQLPPLFPSVDLRGAITQRPERQFTSGLVCAKALFLVFHGHQSACELSLWSLFATFLTSVCIGVIRPFKSSMIANLMSTLLTAGVGLLLNKLIGLFYRYEFSHAHND